MNALNILSGVTSTPSPTPPRSRAPSSGDIHTLRHSSREGPTDILGAAFTSEKLRRPQQDDGHDTELDSDATLDEKTPLVPQQHSDPFVAPKQSSKLWRIPKRIADAVVASLKVVLTTIASPARYVVACFYDDQANFSAMAPVRALFRSRKRTAKTYPANQSQEFVQKEGYHEKPRLRPKEDHLPEIRPAERSLSVDSNATIASESESEKSSSTLDDSPARNTRSRSAARDEIAPAKKSIRIKLNNEEALKKRRQHSRATKSVDHQNDKVAAVANSLKSPSSPASNTKLKYPRAPAAPRPLVPRRQPSYTFSHSSETPKKTLILDLDETLIHSMAKGGRMSTGHMVEVKIAGPIGGNGLVLGPQVPILYYVHERPHCHEFLRKVCSGFDLCLQKTLSLTSDLT